MQFYYVGHFIARSTLFHTICIKILIECEWASAWLWRVLKQMHQKESFLTDTQMTTDFFFHFFFFVSSLPRRQYGSGKVWPEKNKRHLIYRNNEFTWAEIVNHVHSLSIFLIFPLWSVDVWFSGVKTTDETQFSDRKFSIVDKR